MNIALLKLQCIMTKTMHSESDFTQIYTCALSIIVLVFVQAPKVDLFRRQCYLMAPSQVLGAKAARPPDNVESMIFLGREDDASVSVS